MPPGGAPAPPERVRLLARTPAGAGPNPTNGATGSRPLGGSGERNINLVWKAGISSHGNVNKSFTAMAGLVPAIPIRDAQPCPPKQDARVKPGHDSDRGSALEKNLHL